MMHPAISSGFHFILTPVYIQRLYQYGDIKHESVLFPTKSNQIAQHQPVLLNKYSYLDHDRDGVHEMKQLWLNG